MNWINRILKEIKSKLMTKLSNLLIDQSVAFKGRTLRCFLLLYTLNGFHLEGFSQKLYIQTLLLLGKLYLISYLQNICLHC